MNSILKLNSPFVMVIFGATGDLTQRKLIPALFHLFQKNLLPEHFFIVGFSRREFSHQDFKEYLENSIKKYHSHQFEEQSWHKFLGKCYFQMGDFNDKKGYLELIEKLSEFDEFLKACVPRFFYLATPPDKYSIILDFLDQTKLSEGCGQGSDKWTKILIEKPFGRSLEDSIKLDTKLSKIFGEEQIYRIDHYLGKEIVQDILAFRFGNTIFDPIWNSKFVDHVQITVSETLGVETRGNFYEGVGALRDVAQSHLLELLAAVAMDEPARFDAENIRNSRTQTIKEIVCPALKDVVKIALRGQYGPGIVNGQKVPGYRQEPNVDPVSNTETYAALKLHIKNKRWLGVPFYLRTGKRLEHKRTQILIVFKEPKLKMLGKPEIEANRLRIRIEPNEGFEVSLNAKKPGLENTFESVPMKYDYQIERKVNEAYEKILIDAMRGDQTLFTRTDEVKASWKLISTIAEGWWQEGDPGFPNYAAGTWGPKEADELLKRDGREWIVK